MYNQNYKHPIILSKFRKFSKFQKYLSNCTCIFKGFLPEYAFFPYNWIRYVAQNDQNKAGIATYGRVLLLLEFRASMAANVFTPLLNCVYVSSWTSCCELMCIDQNVNTTCLESVSAVLLAAPYSVAICHHCTNMAQLPH